MNEIVKTISDYMGFIVTGATAIALCIKPFRKWFVARFKKQDSEELIAINKLSERVDKLDKKVDRNEMDRLKDEIFRVGNAARQGRAIISEEFRNVSENFEKYRRMGGNCGISKEYDFICDYYNGKGWISHENGAVYCDNCIGILSCDGRDSERDLASVD